MFATTKSEPNETKTDTIQTKRATQSRENRETEEAPKNRFRFRGLLLWFTVGKEK